MENYKIVSAFTLSSLERRVNRALLDGYLPVGGLSVLETVSVANLNRTIFVQAMLKTTAK